MIINLSPQRRDDTVNVSVDGDVITINGEAFDFSSLPDGATIPEVPSDWISGTVDRADGQIHLTLILPHGPAPSQSVAFPEPLAVTIDGPVDLPHDLTLEEITAILDKGMNMTDAEALAVYERLEALGIILSEVQEEETENVDA